MKVLYLVDGSKDADARAVAIRRSGGFFPRLAALPDVQITFASLISEGNLHIAFRQMGLAGETVAADPWLHLSGGTIRLAKLLRKERFDMISASGPIPTVVAGSAKRLTRGVVPLAYYRRHEFGSWKLQVASRTAAKLSDVTYVQAEAVARRAEELDRSRSDRIRLVRHGAADLRSVDPDEVADLRRILGIPLDAPVVGAVARLRSEKGLTNLIDAMGELRDLEAHLVIVGNGPLLAALKRQATDALDDRAHVVGHRDDIALWFALADVAVLPSLRESFPTAAVEAMAARRAVVASKVGGLAEAVVDEVTGLLVPPSDPSSLAAALRRLLKDPQLRERMGEAGRARYEERFTLDCVAASLHEAWIWTLERAG